MYKVLVNTNLGKTCFTNVVYINIILIRPYTTGYTPVSFTT